MDISQWPQGMGLGGITTEQRRPRPQQEQALNCPRCNSANTKFCYYNNYSLSQPRYFCKACRRYWTVGGSLRNVPVGGSTRKHKRPSPSTPSSSSKISHPVSQNPKTHQGQDLNLAYPPSTSDFNSINPSPNPFGNATYSCGLISQQKIKPIGLGFCLEGFGNGYGSRVEGVEETSAARVFFPFEELKQAPSRRDDQFGENLKGQGGHSSTGYWTGMLGGGSNW